MKATDSCVFLAIQRAVADGVTVRQACREQGIAETTFSKWRRRHPTPDPPAPEPEPEPKAFPANDPPTALEELEAMREIYQGLAPFSREARVRILDWIDDALGFEHGREKT